MLIIGEPDTALTSDTAYLAIFFPLSHSGL